MRGFVSLIILASALMVTTVYSQDSTQLRGPKGADYGAQGRSIGPIKPTDTLWRIAVKVRPDNSVSIYQVMQALYNKNPNSFLEQNLNHMRSGSYLKIPTLAEIRRVNPQLAKQRSEQDDDLWEKKKNGTLTQAEINSAQTQVTQARKADVDEAKKELQQELKAIKTDQGNKLVELQQQFKSSVSNVEEILVENNNLKKQLTGISNELENVRLQLGQDSEIQQQLKELILKQNEIIAQQKLKEVEQESEFSFAALLSNPLVLILLMTIPALLIIFAVVMWLRKRSNNQEPESDDDEFIPQAPAFTDPIDEVPEPTLDEAPAPDPLDDISVQLDDNMDDVLLDDDVDLNDDLDDDSLLDQDELESLLSDDVVFEDENTEDDELDVFMQQDFDSSDEDDTGDTINLDESDDILSSDDLDSLFDEEDDDALPDEPKGESNDDMAALSEELAEEGEDFNIDDLLDENNEQADDVTAQADDGEFDIDSLLDAEQPATEDQSEEPDIDSLVDEDDEVDIDELLDAEQPDTETATQEPDIDS
ncbi:FimV/HubP family polar landmark protein [Pseudoalteromonas sp. S1608]|uniref:FimV/HubP family polar landmark protein n=1 Tax=Pseudoalteromonas sp. S1608 TaxID=579504 RepID=UPI002017501A|nr:FimV/HubP family polar landmark protein [Pseudoalteromonas sp. S1608]